jgi:hypothetical protein
LVRLELAAHGLELVLAEVEVVLIGHLDEVFQDLAKGTGSSIEFRQGLLEDG